MICCLYRSRQVVALANVPIVYVSGEIAHFLFCPITLNICFLVAILWTGKKMYRFYLYVYIISVRSWNFYDFGFFLNPSMNYGLSKSAKIVLSKSILMSKIKLSQNINLGDHFLLKTFFLNSIFKPLYFLELHSIFEESSA